MVGDIGEVIAAEIFDVKLFEKLENGYDAISRKGKKRIQIKATFGNTLTFPPGEENIPDYFIGIKLYKSGNFEIIFNGPGKIIFELVKNRKQVKYRLHNVSVSTIKKVNLQVLMKNRIKERKYG